MTLSALISKLESMNIPETSEVHFDFCSAFPSMRFGSSRCYYERLAIGWSMDPRKNKIPPFKDFFARLKEAMKEPLFGYKGGEFWTNRDAPLHVDNYGDYNPVHNWIRVCYNWMVGNVNRNLIRYQQGDLVFVDASDKTDLSFEKQVTGYDNHKFTNTAEFVDGPKTGNILGYAKFENVTTIEHHEHDHVDVEPGTYAIYQCRSWEANPRGIWSLRID